MKHLIFLLLIIGAISCSPKTGTTTFSPNDKPFTISGGESVTISETWTYKGFHCAFDDRFLNSKQYWVSFTEELNESNFDAKTPGIVGVGRIDRYTFEIRVGLLFDGKKVLKDYIDSKRK